VAVKGGEMSIENENSTATSGGSAGRNNPALKSEQVEALLTISALLNSDLNAGRVLRDLLVQVCALFRADQAAVFLREKLPLAEENKGVSEARRQDIGKVICAANTGLSEAYLASLTAFYEKKEFRQLQSQRRPVYIADARTDARLNGLREVNTREGFRTMLTLPLLHREALIGTLILYHYQPHSYTEQETRLLTVFANQAALAITNARLYETARQREKDAALLAEAGRIFNSSLKTGDVLNWVVRTVGGCLGNSALVYIIQEGSDAAHPVAFYSSAVQNGEIKVTSPVKENAPVKLGSGPIGKSMQTGVSFLLRDPAEILKSIPFLTKEYGVNSLVCVPLKTRGRIIGSLLSYMVTYGASDKSIEEDQLGLAQALADRAAVAIENARMYEAAKREQRVKDEFLTLVSHELNTPLTNMKGYNHLLAKRLEESKPRGANGQPNRAVENLRQFTTIIGGQIDRLQYLVTDLARISQIESGQVELHMLPRPLLPLIQDAVAQVEEQLKIPGGPPVRHKFDVVARKNNLSAEVDPAVFSRIMHNLLTNAVKFSPNGGAIRIDLTLGPSQTVKVAVTDNGLGISEQDLPHIFERFYKASSQPGRANGLGLGLFISRNLAQAMHGQLIATSEEGKGSTFMLLLPRFGHTAPIPENQQLPDWL
jgi:signal transduction histidine kinase